MSYSNPITTQHKVKSVLIDDLEVDTPITDVIEGIPTVGALEVAAIGIIPEACAVVPLRTPCHARLRATTVQVANVLMEITVHIRLDTEVDVCTEKNRKTVRNHWWCSLRVATRHWREVADNLKKILHFFGISPRPYLALLLLQVWAKNSSSRFSLDILRMFLVEFTIDKSVLTKLRQLHWHLSKQFLKMSKLAEQLLIVLVDPWSMVTITQ